MFSAATPEQKHDFREVTDGISTAEDRIREATSRILQLESETSEEVLHEINVRIRQTQSELDDLDRQIDEQDISEEDLEKANQIDMVLGCLREQERNLRRLIELLNEAKQVIEVDVKRYNEVVLAISQLLASLDLSESNISKLEQVQANVESLLKLLEKADQELRITLREIEAQQRERDSFDTQVAQRSALLEKKREVQDVHDAARGELENVENLKSEMAVAKEGRRKSYLKMLNDIKRNEAMYSEIIRSFSAKQSTLHNLHTSGEGDVLREIQFFAEMQFDREFFIQRAKELFHLKRVVVEGDDSDFKEFLKLCDEYVCKDNSSVQAIYDVVETHFDDFELRRKTVKATSMESYGGLFFANYFSIRPVIQYKNTSVDRLSLGQKATVLIKIYLKHGTNPIIIDSHDDHLDNQFIMKELIPALREAKKYRQIVLVSNNANVVVNSDAEQIVIAEHDKGQISYVAGSLENLDIRTKAIEVLEGGEPAFRERQQKYRMN